MTLEIPLAPAEELLLRERAAAAGKDVQTFVREALFEKLCLHSGAAGAPTGGILRRTGNRR
jgi:hypothetical protein